MAELSCEEAGWAQGAVSCNGQCQLDFGDCVSICGDGLVTVGEEIEREYGIPIINKRVSVTPVALIAEASSSDDYVLFAEYLERVFQRFRQTMRRFVDDERCPYGSQFGELRAARVRSSG